MFDNVSLDPTSPAYLVSVVGDGSATYLPHPVVLVSVMLAFREVPLGAPLKFLVVSVVAVPVCFASEHSGHVRPPTLS